MTLPRLLTGTLLGVLTLVSVAAALLFLYPRPPDTTEARVFEESANVNYCELPLLSGHGPAAADIPKAYTPGCGWEEFPAPVLAACTEPLAPDADDLRGLWQSVTPGFEHVERIEQCGDRVVVTTKGIIHDFHTDGTLANGSRDIEPPRCMNTWVAIEWRDRTLSFRPFGGPVVLVTRRLADDNLVWKYPGRDEVRMQRICRLPGEGS